MKLKKFILFIFCAIVSVHLRSQDTKRELANTSLLSNQSKTIDTTKPNVLPKDSLIKKKFHDPRIATRRSLIIPGWGQAYNREYWKIPIVYGALAIPTYTYFFSIKYYNITSFAYNALYQATYGSNGIAPTHADSAGLQNIDPLIKDAVIAGRFDLAGLQSARNYYKKNQDYSVLWFILIWGLNIADATVFGHLKNFDVSNDLSLHVEPKYDPVFKAPGVSLVFSLKNSSSKINSAR
jgi:hypothetical protein